MVLISASLMTREIEYLSYICELCISLVIVCVGVSLGVISLGMSLVFYSQVFLSLLLR